MRADLQGKKVPRLLLVSEGAPAPALVDPLEDWIRVPADDADIQARLQNLVVRASKDLQDQPQVDEHGVLRFRSEWVSLSPLEARLAGALVERFGAVASRETLIRLGWPDGAPSRNIIDVMMLRLRRRLEPLGLAIRTVRARGYLLQPMPVSA